jgi:hypothetical protein
MKNNMLVLLGALVGGIVGHVACVWMVHQGFYGMVLPGGVAGLGAGIFRCKSLAVAVVCGVWALFAGLVTEWHVEPFIANDSFGYMLTHFYDLRPLTLIMLAAGAFIGFWLPFRQTQDFVRGK